MPYCMTVSCCDVIKSDTVSEVFWAVSIPQNFCSTFPNSVLLTLTLLPVQSISFKKISDMVKQFRTLYWSTFELEAFQLHNQE